MTTAAPPPLAPGMTVLERGWLSSNTVLLKGSDEVVVVDTGYWTHAAQTVELVAAAAEGVPVGCIINTHLHSDHCGGNAGLQQRHPAARTLIPPGQAAFVHDWDPVALTYEPTGQHCPPFRADGTLNPGDTLVLAGREWQIHAAPGHDPHSIVLFDPASRTLLSADALWENGFGIVFPELEGERAFEDVAGTLDTIERLSPRFVVPGHGPVFTDISAALASARSRLQAYVARPERHGAHAAKVLLKFKMLEVQRIARSDFIEWATGTDYFSLVHQRWFGHLPKSTWIAGLVADLQRSGALAVDGPILHNA